MGKALHVNLVKLHALNVITFCGLSILQSLYCMYVEVGDWKVICCYTFILIQSIFAFTTKIIILPGKTISSAMYFIYIHVCCRIRALCRVGPQ